MELDPVSLTLGAVEAGIGLFNQGKTKREAARLQATRPKIARSQFAKDNLALAESELASGMSAEAENGYEQSSDRSLSTSLDSVLKYGGSVNSVSDLYDADQQGRAKLAILKDSIRNNKVDRAVRAAQYADEDDRMVFQYNEDAPWKDAAQANAQARLGARNQIMSGLNTVGSSLMRSRADAREDKMLTNYFNPSTPQSGSNLRRAIPRSTSNYLAPNVYGNFDYIQGYYPFQQDEFGG